MDSKTQWRQELLDKRNNLDSNFVREASRKIERHLLLLEEFNLAERIGLYSACRNEVETQNLFTKAHVSRKEVFYPAVNPKTKEIHFYRIKNLNELEPGYAGILEPKKRAHPLSDINFLNLIVVPGVAFDKKGNRIGFGHGFYDRLLKPYRGKRIAFAYEFQIVDSLPSQPRDERVDVIVSEERILRIV
ncbi:MAG: 5-formyltetrahydrofolate cyclo-ligase [Deltaproteobacteria bacterium RIFCSPLOWO2_01_44_7]|nr:MAG: 5-formyltetrahydrofolate cyclo-ligase [Deltaproteobacteria bacterium RIFCSPHIGHO2_01_FULL_43_49]OGQ15643.1 MAG: 5-formyltetrahydrofolate cyclo-ligase [Deltaproteobacteria bacterium RIFCSPHIGHO2_02_FULL_44_53]OGQ28612.1 MAG: 5-formyltetrahydrofolate cyclo-ligase [Deltaproteobacteria bacterium RIFCSPHIGHO2_12_FULL_44_21]OGQ31934.1 MAG: 5-formyltetrahydrofolate cyclo-ligase [Deltaproteobacteria bacterium RIFCSPLOWO2_01_FULL_45_74]OGQ38476.1 MAG: 5-formyltetrahydrofolate cyclo-ligase [Delta